jgi:hypothetical protein
MPPRPPHLIINSPFLRVAHCGPACGCNLPLIDGSLAQLGSSHNRKFQVLAFELRRWRSLNSTAKAPALQLRPSPTLEEKKNSKAMSTKRLYLGSWYPFCRQFRFSFFADFYTELPADTRTDDVNKHFEGCGPTTDVRVMTGKMRNASVNPAPILRTRGPRLRVY